MFDDSRSRSDPARKWRSSAARAAARARSSSWCSGFTTWTGGRITIDGHDIALVTQASLRRAIALVPQEPVLFHRSLAENIAYARPRPAIPRSCGRRASPMRMASSRPAAGRRDPGRRARREAVRRRAPAGRDRARDPGRPAGADPGRGHIVLGFGLGAGDPGRPGRAHGGADHDRDRAPAFDRPPGRSHRGVEAGRVVEEGTHDQLVASPGGRYRRLYETQAGAFDAGSVL